MKVILDTIPSEVLTMPHGGMHERGSGPRLVSKNHLWSWCITSSLIV